MYEIYIWIVAFLSLYVSVFWIIISNQIKLKNFPKIKNYPFITIAVPVWNEEKTIINTLQSLIELDYDKDKLEIFVINDGSTDSTEKILKEFLKKNKLDYIKLISQKNKGKAGALNTALKYAKGQFFCVFDADSVADKNSLKLMLPYFFSDKIGAVISPIKVYEPKNWIERIQRLEYIFSSFVRKLMSNVGTLHITHGVLSIFRKDIIEKLGGFDDNKNLTEDYEMAMKLRKNHYQILLCEENINYTKVPNTMKTLWFQRVRWFRGFIFNSLKYKDMIMKKRYGLLGRFQIPLELLTVLIVFASVGFFSYQLIKKIYNFFIKISILKLHLFDFFTIPTFKKFILEMNFKIVFPSFIVLITGLYLYTIAHKYLREKWKFHLVSFIYLFLYPVVRSLQWVHALILQLTKAKGKWR